MKNSILLTFALCIALCSQAQDFQKWKIGFKLNPNYSWIKPDAKNINNDGGQFRLGFSLVIDKHFTANYAFGTGLNIFRTGGQLSYLRLTNETVPPLSGTYDVISKVSRKYSMQYGEIPLTLKLRTNEIGYITYWGQFGLGLGFNIRSKADQEVDYLYEKTGPADNRWVESTLPSTSVEDEDIKDDINLFRTSLIIGGGIEYTLSGNTAIVAGITYNNGFSNVLKNSGVSTDDRDAVIYDGSGDKKAPRTYKLKGMNNFIELNIGIMF